MNRINFIKWSLGMEGDVVIGGRQRQGRVTISPTQNMCYPYSLILCAGSRRLTSSCPLSYFGYRDYARFTVT